MQVYRDDIDQITNNPDVSKVLDMSAGFIHDLISNIYGGYYAPVYNGIPVVMSVGEDPSSLLLTTPMVDIEVNDLTMTIGSGFTEGPISKGELISLTTILIAIYSIMEVNNMVDPEQFTNYQFSQ